MEFESLATVPEEAAGAPKSATRELSARLRDHFIPPRDQLSHGGAGAVYLTEVTAPDSARRADAVHVGLWSSRGAGRVDVCELKVSRADFRRELADPGKVEAWWPYSSTFSIVAPSVEVAPSEELPPGWGLLVPQARGRRFKTVVKPEERTPALTIPLLVTLLKSTETIRTNALRRQADELRAEFRERERRVRRRHGQVDPEEVHRLELLERLERAMGMRISDYSWSDDRIDPEAVAEGLAAFMAGHAARVRAREEAERRARDLDHLAERVRAEAARLRKSLSEVTA